VKLPQPRNRRHPVKSTRPFGKPARCAGLTLVELVLVMVLISGVSAVVVTQISSYTKHKALVQADQLRRDVAHMQLLAISQSARMRLTVSGGSSYSVTYQACPTGTCTVGNTVTDPATAQAFTVTASTNVTISPTTATLEFDSLGRPLSSGALSTASQNLVVTGASRSATVTVAPLTGFATLATQ
jgi:MSHA pilin protein MshC